MHCKNDGEVETLKEQKALDVKFVVFGLTDAGQSLYRTYDEAGIVPILQRSTSDKKLVNEAIKVANAKYRDAKAKLYGTSAPAPTPAPSPKPAPAPKPKGEAPKPKGASKEIAKTKEEKIKVAESTGVTPLR